MRKDMLPTQPKGEIFENEFFIAETYLQGDPDSLAEEIARIMRTNNRLSSYNRKALMAPSCWKKTKRGIRFALVGRAQSDGFCEEWKDEEEDGYARTRRENTTYGAEQFLKKLFSTAFSVRPLSVGRKKDRLFIDAMEAMSYNGFSGFLAQHEGYPSVDDLISAGNQSSSVLGSQGGYAVTSPYFSATLLTRKAQKKLDTKSLSSAVKIMMNATGVQLAPQAIFQREDGRFELRIVGCCHKYISETQNNSYRRNHVRFAHEFAPATSAVQDPIEHYLGLKVDALRIFKTTADDFKDIVAAEEVADELELIGVPEPEDFIIKSEQEVRAELEARRRGKRSFEKGKKLSTKQELARLVGLKDAKRQLQEFVTFAAMQRERGGTIAHLHSCFTGNPGTGKTTLARIFGHMLYDAGLLPKRNVFVETSGLEFSDEDIKRARRGVLFIDEAYTLGWTDLAVLVKAMEDCHRNFERDGFIVVLAGYPDEMEKLVAVNPGMRDRIGAFINFEDYNHKELVKIFMCMAKREAYTLDDAAKSAISEKLRQVEMLKDTNFSNARLVRKIFERIQMRTATTYGAESAIHADTIEDVFRDEFADLVGGRRRSESAKDVDDELTGDEQLDQLVGLSNVKAQIREFLDYAAVQKKRGGKMPSLHMRFDGNPGTGKTTLARIIGHMMYDRGLLARRDGFVECDRESLVGPFVGWTAKLTKKKIAEARHGVLFVDEAYSLDGGQENDFGKEALSTLVKAMEDSLVNYERDGFVCIMAGYPELMDKMVSINPGLRDRFGLTVRFDDYNADELISVFELYAKKEQYRLTRDGRAYLREQFQRIVAAKDDDFGNARLVRKIFERTKMRQAILHGTSSQLKVDVFEQVFAEPDMTALFRGSKTQNIGFCA